VSHIRPHKSAGWTPWYDLLYEHCEDKGGYLAIESWPIGKRTPQAEVLPNATFVIRAYWGSPPSCRGSGKARRIEEAAQLLCRQLDLNFADAA
jgi:hypothetical protein